MRSGITLLAPVIALSLIAAACDKPTSVSPPASPQVRPHDQSADSIVALLMALRRDKKEASERDASEANRAGESPKAKPFAEPTNPENG
jgi:hypothetical protein